MRGRVARHALRNASELLDRSIEVTAAHGRLMGCIVQRPCGLTGTADRVNGFLVRTARFRIGFAAFESRWNKVNSSLTFLRVLSFVNDRYKLAAGTTRDLL